MQTDCHMTLQCVSFIHSTGSLGLSPCGVQKDGVHVFHCYMVYFNISLDTDVYLGCFQFWAFMKEASANTCGTALPGNASQRKFLGLAFLSAK